MYLYSKFCRALLQASLPKESDCLASLGGLGQCLRYVRLVAARRHRTRSHSHSITDDGTVFRGYDESFWAHHIGMRHLNNLTRKQQSLALRFVTGEAFPKKMENFILGQMWKFPRKKL